MCTCTEDEANDPECIKRGFCMDRDILELNQLFLELEEKGQLEKKWKPKDYGKHTGLRRRPKFAKLKITKVRKSANQLSRYLLFIHGPDHLIHSTIFQCPTDDCCKSSMK